MQEFHYWWWQSHHVGWPRGCTLMRDIIRSSALGLILRDRPGFTSNMRLVDTRHANRSNEWELPWGERRVVVENYREMLVNVENPDGRQLLIRFRAFDDGRTYVAEIYRDGQDAHWDSNPYAIAIEEKIVDSNDSLELTLAAGGGVAVRFWRETQAELK
ncbi:MAG: glycoside hydrolase family 97 N-terminal domain-containing protein [Woeseiaceae bacterium]|nr:glycoside hydrolase family 97 N-terminal domain-containing protein [Woeseiaceae bacterium]